MHYVRDVTLGEDAGQAWMGATPHVLAALRDGLLALLRALDWTTIVDALRHDGAYVHRALHLLATPCLPLTQPQAGHVMPRSRPRCAMLRGDRVSDRQEARGWRQS